MVFPTGAYHMEFAADHLDRLLGKSILDRFVHKRSVAQDGHAGGTDEPQHSGERRRPEAEGDGDDEHGGVELGRRRAKHADIKIATLELADAVRPANDEQQDKKQRQVRDERVDAQHDKHAHVVCREVAQVVVHARLGLAEARGFRDALEVEEVGERAQVGEARGERLGAHAGEAVAQVEA